MTTTLRIKDWKKLFEKADLREGRVVEWKYVPIPIRLNGEGYKRLMRTPKGRDAFGVFIALCELAANMPTRGVLANDRGPLSVESIHLKTSIPVKAVASAITILTSPEIGWVVSDDSCSPNGETPYDERPTAALPQPPPTEATGDREAPPPSGWAAADSQSDKAKAVAALTAEPWPGLSPRKAEGVADKADLPTILAAIQRGRAKNERGEKIGAGLIATWISDGSAKKWADNDAAKRRRGIRAKWDETGAEAKSQWIAAYCERFPDAAALDRATVAESDRFMDWLDVAARENNRRATA